jgi:hypothetical protein
MVSRSAIGPKGAPPAGRGRSWPVRFFCHSLAGASPTSPEQAEQHHAHELGISVGGVEIHIRRVLTNLGARDRAESAFVAVSHWPIMVKLAIPEQQTPPPLTLGPGTLPRVDL